MNNAPNIIAAMVRIWRANVTLTEIPLFPLGKVTAGNRVKYATVSCAPGAKEYNSGLLYTQEYTLTFVVFSTNSLNDAQAVIDVMGYALDFVRDTFAEVRGTVLSMIPIPEDLVPDADEQLGKIVHTITARWSIKVCQQRTI